MNYLNALSQIVPSSETSAKSPDTPSESMEVDMNREETMLINNLTDKAIVLTAVEKARIYRPWSYSVIIKLTRRKINHAYLKNRLSVLWKPTEELILIDLGSDYFIVQFLKKENLQTTLQKVSWFINGAFLSVRKWHPNVAASEANETVSAIWIRLPELPTEYYDHSILTKIGSKLGKLVKTDICTSTTLRGRYARICIEVPMGVPVKKHIYIGSLKQFIVYEGADILCTNCGMIGHTLGMCHNRCTIPATMLPEETTDTTPQTQTPHNECSKEDWQVVNFKKRTKNNQFKVASRSMDESTSFKSLPRTRGISVTYHQHLPEDTAVRVDNTDTSKSTDYQTTKYIVKSKDMFIPSTSKEGSPTQSKIKDTNYHKNIPRSSNSKPTLNSPQNIENGPDAILAKLESKVPGMSEGSMLIYSTPKAPLNPNPTSWVEIDLQVQALVTHVYFEDRQVMCVISTPELLSYLALEGIRREMELYNSHIWMSIVLQAPINFPVPTIPFFTWIIEDPTFGNAGGLAVMWDDSILELDEIATTNQEIHAIVKVRDNNDT
ncbi:uncharacterized protein LOC107841639 [Capsicum annuum]|uniref:uncharacterized protein LOC107841639 n=1 Tax=Capsicum annuum TaxID=4072 RepID=UPI001FB099DA|nr:uncharacterized protein LOC107841639 [Capsicum annuum]